MINFSEIRNIMEAARSEHFTSKGLDTMEGIYYMNSNDGTDFDFTVNGRVCEFYIFKPNGDGLIKFLAEEGDTYTMHVFDHAEPYGDEIVTKTGNLPFSVADLATYLYAEFDGKDRYDEAVGDWELSESQEFDFSDDSEDEYDYEEDLF